MMRDLDRRQDVHMLATFAADLRQVFSVIRQSRHGDDVLLEVAHAIYHMQRAASLIKGQ